MLQSEPVVIGLEMFGWVKTSWLIHARKNMGVITHNLPVHPSFGATEEFPNFWSNTPILLSLWSSSLLKLRNGGFDYSTKTSYLATISFCAQVADVPGVCQMLMRQKMEGCTRFWDSWKDGCPNSGKLLEWYVAAAFLWLTNLWRGRFSYIKRLLYSNFWCAVD